MNIPLIAASACIICSVVGGASVQALRYQSGNPHYEMTQTLGISMEGAASEEVKVFARFGLTIAPEKGDTLNLVVDVDSASMTSDGKTETFLPRGARTVVRLLNSGKPAVAPSDGDMLGALVGELFVRLPATGGIGATFVDSIVEVDEDLRDMGIPSMTMVARTSIVGDTTVDGTPAWKLDLSGNLVPIQKDSTMAAGSIKMGVTGDFTGTAYVSRTGTLLSMTRKVNVTMRMNMTLMGNSQGFTMQQSTTTVGRRLK